MTQVTQRIAHYLRIQFNSSNNSTSINHFEQTMFAKFAFNYGALRALLRRHFYFRKDR